MGIRTHGDVLFDLHTASLRAVNHHNTYLAVGAEHVELGNEERNILRLAEELKTYRPEPTDNTMTWAEFCEEWEDDAAEIAEAISDDVDDETNEIESQVTDTVELTYGRGNLPRAKDLVNAAPADVVQGAWYSATRDYCESVHGKRWDRVLQYLAEQIEEQEIFNRVVRIREEVKDA